jgi:hypothetical protein
MKLVTFGKHKGKNFAQACTLKHYVKWVLDVENATGRLRELQEYFADNEGIVLPPVPKKMYRQNHYRAGPPRFIEREPWQEVTDPHNIGECHGFAN